MTGSLPPPEECVLPAMLDAQCRTRGDKPLVVFSDDSIWTYGEARQLALRTAAGLQRLGIVRGELVLVWLPSGPEILRIHLALGYLGGVLVPINTASKGASLAHVIANSGARLIICHSGLADRLGAVDCGQLDRIVLVGGSGPVPPGLELLSEAVLEAPAEAFDPPSPPVAAHEPHGIFYTSGTTGPSKGVICPHVHTAVMSRMALRYMGPDDRFMLTLPYHHLGGAYITFGVIGLGASMTLLKEYRTQTFWSDVRRTGSTSCLMLGSISTFLMKQPAQPDDRNHPLRHVIQQPLDADPAAFASRFGLTIYTQLDMTEMPSVIASGPIVGEPRPHGYCGSQWQGWPGFDIRLVDEHDCEVPEGVAGELVVRCDLPFILTPGYHAMPEATARVWRNGWFHTGDILRRDADGGYLFLDRAKDSIRRRGENISSAELEGEVLRHPAIANAAAIAVKSALGEDDVMVALEPKPGETITPRELIEFLIPRVPYFMVPRYVRVMQRLPYTQTQKVQKSTLRTEGIGVSGVFDREAEGIIVKRDRIG